MERIRELTSKSTANGLTWEEYLRIKDIKNIEPFEVFVEKTKETGIDKSSKLKFNYPQTIDRERLKEHLGIASREIMEKAKLAWKISFDVENW